MPSPNTIDIFHLSQSQQDLGVATSTGQSTTTANSTIPTHATDSNSSTTSLRNTNVRTSTPPNPSTTSHDDFRSIDSVADNLDLEISSGNRDSRNGRRGSRNSFPKEEETVVATTASKDIYVSLHSKERELDPSGSVLPLVKTDKRLGKQQQLTGLQSEQLGGDRKPDLHGAGHIPGIHSNSIRERAPAAARRKLSGRLGDNAGNEIVNGGKPVYPNIGGGAGFKSISGDLDLELDLGETPKATGPSGGSVLPSRAGSGKPFTSVSQDLATPSDGLLDYKSSDHTLKPEDLGSIYRRR